MRWSKQIHSKTRVTSHKVLIHIKDIQCYTSQVNIKEMNQCLQTRLDMYAAT